jgi:RHS repeat-associated protein
VNTTYAYDPVSRLTSVLHKLGTTTLDGATYTYDNAGNRLTRTDKRTNVTLTYGYDNIYQLLSAKQGTTTKESYSYDLVGNRLSSLGVSPYNYNSSNELTSTPSLTYGYDNNGNTKTKSDGTQYSWDYENRLTQVVLPGSGGTVNFKYDPFGRRVQKSFTQGSTTTTTNYLYDGLNLVEEVDSNGNVLAKYTQENEIDEPLAELRSGTTSYYEQDGQGSISSLSNSSGSLANTYTYDSFGKLTASTGSVVNPFQYTAREFDTETGLYFNRARYLDPASGRWLTEDPIRFLGGHDFYAYVLNNPLKYRDPLGKQSQMPSCYPDCVRTPEEQQQIARENYEWNVRIFGPPPAAGLPSPGTSSQKCKCKHPSVSPPKTGLEDIAVGFAEVTHVLDLAAVNASMVVAAGGGLVASGALIAGGCFEPSPFEPVTCAAGAVGAGSTFAGAVVSGRTAVWFFENYTLPAIMGEEDCSD